MENIPFVSIIIPMRNERVYIGDCISSLITQDYPKYKYEVIVVDGGSNDNSKELVRGYEKSGISIKILENPKQITSSGLNIGIKNAQGDIIIILSAHSTVNSNFVAKNIEYLQKTEASCVGGVMLTIGVTSFIGKAISLAMSSPFGVGNSMFRIGVKEPTYVDTVPFGAYRKEVFSKIGLFDEELVRNQDDEFNMRLIKNGGKILLVPEIVSYYYARDSLSKLWGQHFQYGYFKPLVWQKIGTLFVWRQLIPATFVASLILTGVLSFLTKYLLWLFGSILGLYLLANIAFSFHTALKKGVKLIFILPITYITLHFGYGLGFLNGIWDFIILKRHLREKIKEVVLTR